MPPTHLGRLGKRAVPALMDMLLGPDEALREQATRGTISSR